MQAELQKRTSLKWQGKSVFLSSSAELWKGVLGMSFPHFLRKLDLPCNILLDGHQFKDDRAFQYLKGAIRKMGTDILAGPVAMRQGVMTLN